MLSLLERSYSLPAGVRIPIFHPFTHSARQPLGATLIAFPRLPLARSRYSPLFLDGMLATHPIPVGFNKTAEQRQLRTKGQLSDGDRRGGTGQPARAG